MVCCGINATLQAERQPRHKEKTLTSVLEDKIAIQDLIATYNQSLDRGDYETWLACWADDAIFDGLGKYLTGIQAIRGFSEGYEVGYRQRLPGLKHFTINVLSNVDGDRANSSAYVQLTSISDKGIRFVLTGRYEDDLKRIDGRWRFARRTLHQDILPVAAAPES